MSDDRLKALDDPATYWRYHAIIKDVISKTVLEELRSMLMVPEEMLRDVILARIDEIEEGR